MKLSWGQAFAGRSAVAVALLAAVPAALLTGPGCSPRGAGAGQPPGLVDGPQDGPLDGPTDAPPSDAPPDGAPIDAPPIDAPFAIAPFDPNGVPDLVLDSERMKGSWGVSYEFFTPDACELQEGCIGGAGFRRLLRFETVTANIGAHDLVAGPLPPVGASEGGFLWSECHGHHHLDGFADYQLQGPGGVVVSGHKQAFCLMDSEGVAGTDIPGMGFDCQNQGISRGWQDVYALTLPCQWIDITDVPSGAYALVVMVNPGRRLEEMDYNNNQFSTIVSF